MTIQEELIRQFQNYYLGEWIGCSPKEIREKALERLDFLEAERIYLRIHNAYSFEET